MEAEKPRKPDINCYVIRSEADRNLENSIYSLRQVIEDTIPLLQNVSEDDPQDIVYIQHPEYVYATDAVSSNDNYKVALEKLCRAKIAIFDITNYEPAVMLLLGIRSVVRRGITITSVGGKFVIGDSVDIPFNIKELNVTSHSEKQHKIKGEEPPYLLNKKIRDGLSQLSTLPQYLDTPAFDAVRNLPPKYRAPDDDNVLVLCSYSEKYQQDNWQFLRYRINLSLEAKKDPRKVSKIYRILDVMSPRLVSHSIYEAIRSMALCIVDWTEWQPNVFFELGVRLAITKSTSHTVCIIDNEFVKLVLFICDHIDEFKEDNAKLNSLISNLTGVDMEKAEEFNAIRDRYLLIAAQCRYLLERFVPLEYSKNPSNKDLKVFRNIMHYYHIEKETNTNAPEPNGCASSDTYETIKESIDPDGEITSIPVYLELLKTAQLFGVDSTEARTSVLYPGRKSLESSVEEGVLQRLLAAWFFIRSWYKDEQIISEDQLFKHTESIALNLLDLLQEIESNPDNADTGKISVSELKKDVYHTLTLYRRKREGLS